MSRSRDFSFLRRPRWLAGHVVALTAVVVFCGLGMWQLRRHDERVELNELIEQRSTSTPVAIDELLDDVTDLTTLEYRRVTASGTYEPSEEVILQNRSLNGISGHHVLTPLLLDDGTAVIVERGWVPIDVAGPPVVEALVPEGRVSVTGIVRLTQTRKGLGPVDPPTGVIDRISRVDIERLRLQSALPLAPIFIVLASQNPRSGDLPVILPEPETDAGPHLSYAVQWFVFAGVVVVGYPILMVRTAAQPSRRRKAQATAVKP